MKARDLTPQQLIDGLDAVAFFTAHVPGLKVNGHLNARCRCPFDCGADNSFSFEQEKGVYFCHRCNAKGNAWGFLAAIGKGPAAIASTLADYQRNGTFRPSSTAPSSTVPRATKPEKPALGPIVATYDYTDEKRDLLFQVTRHEPKTFRQRRPDGNGGWIYNLADTRRVLYRLPELLDAVKADWTIYVVEGEQDADAINRLESGGEFFATCNPGGAGKWLPEYSDVLRDARVVVIADRDEPGRKHALDVRAALKGIAASARFVQAKTGKDAADHLAAGHGLEDFVPMEGPAATDEADEPTVVLPYPADLYGALFTPRRPDFDVKSFLRRSGLVLAWSAPGGLKTHTAMVLCHEMLCDTGKGRLFGHPDLWINRRWKRVLWIATEESGDELRHQAEEILRGLGKDKIDGELHYLFAATAGNRVTLDDLAELIVRDGPWDAIVLDSLTGLRPKVVNGVSVKWDLDNDAGNEMCLKLRGLAAQHGVCFLILHHSGRDTTRYRGGVDWWASADTMFGLLPDNGRVKVDVEKVRGGKKPAAFTLEPEWAADGSFTLTYAGSAAPAKLSESAKAMLLYLMGKGSASQAEMIVAVGCARSTGTASIRALVQAKLAIDTGTKKDKSPVYTFNESTITEVSGQSTGHLGDKDA